LKIADVKEEKIAQASYIITYFNDVETMF